MKKILLFSLMLPALIGVLVACSFKTNEEKARDLIEPQIKDCLIKPESYEFAKIQLDSCFSDDLSRRPEVVVFAMKVSKLWEEYKGYVSAAERAESVMTIYAPSYSYQSAHDKQQHKKYKAEMEKAQHKAADVKEKIIQLYKDIKQLATITENSKHEFVGWQAIFDYRVETAGGIKTISESLFFLNKDLSDITHHFTEDDIKLISPDVSDLKFEFEAELKEIFENNLSQ